MKRFIITEEEKNHIKGLYEQISVPKSPQSLLDNPSEVYNKSIGVKTLPDCFKGGTDLSQSGVFDKEVDQVVDSLDMPMNNDDPKRLLQWIQGNGFPGVMGGSGNYGALKDRVIQIDGLWYPAVEDLRVKYNLDEVMETLGGSVKKISNVNSSLLECYSKWISCISGIK